MASKGFWGVSLLVNELSASDVHHDMPIFEFRPLSPFKTVIVRHGGAYVQIRVKETGELWVNLEQSGGEVLVLSVGDLDTTIDHLKKDGVMTLEVPVGKDALFFYPNALGFSVLVGWYDEHPGLFPMPKLDVEEV